MSDNRYRIDIEGQGKRWTWTVWAWGCQYGKPGTEAWRPPIVALDDLEWDLADEVTHNEGRARSEYAAELRARCFIALCETRLSHRVRRLERRVQIHVGPEPHKSVYDD